MSAATRNTRDLLRAALAKDGRIHAWQIRSTRATERQTYLVRTQLEAERTVEDETHQVAVFVKNGDLLGRADVNLGAGDDLARRLDEAVFMAGLGGDAMWSLPGPGPVPEVEAFDPSLDGPHAAATSRELVERWRHALDGLDARPSSMELFCISQDVRFENSAGFTARWNETRVSMLNILLAKHGDREAERESWEERRRAGDLDMDAIIARTAEEAIDLTRAVPPPSGAYPVVIDAVELTALMGPILVNASGQSLYTKTSRFEPGKPIPVEVEDGEPLTLASNAIAPFGLGSYAFDIDGVPGRRAELVKDNVFVQPWSSKQFADYLGIEPTGAFANLELPPGATPLDDLLTGPRVLHVHAFSWLTPDQGRGNFSSEIRIGHLYENGARTPVKGGSVSGNVFKAFGRARYARESVARGNSNGFGAGRYYIGPAAARIEGLTVAGA